MVSEEKLQTILSNALKAQKDEIINEFKKEIKALSSKVENIKKIADEALNIAKQNKADIVKVSAEVDSLNEKFNALNTEHNQLQVQSAAKDQAINNLENKLEDTTNRHLRKTLVIKGVKELENETWTATESVLAKTISEATDGDVDEIAAARMIERAHLSETRSP